MGIFFIILVATIISQAMLIYYLSVLDKNRVLAAWLDLEAKLRRRHNLIPRLSKVTCNTPLTKAL